MNPTITESMTKNEIRDVFLELAESAGKPLSKARANKIADKFKKSKLGINIRQMITSPTFAQMIGDPELAKAIQYRDETGERAVNHVFAEQIVKEISC